MPYPTISGAKDAGFPTTAEGAPMTLAQINKLAEIYDAVKTKPGIKTPMAVAWTQWKKIYKKVGTKWVKKEMNKETDRDKEYRLQSNITKSEETKKGDWVVWGYASTFDIDSRGDQITKEALIEAQSDYEEYSTVLFNHDHDRPIGKVIDTEVDDVGLLIKVMLSKTEKELWTKVKEGIISKFSVAGRIIEETPTENGVYQITKLRFHEVSLVSVPANKKAEAIDDYIVKSQKNNTMNITNKLKEIAKTRTAKEIKENIHLLVDSLEANTIDNDEHIKNSSIMDIFTNWGPAEPNEIAIYASSDGSGDIDKIDWDKYKQCFAWCDPENTKSFDGYKLQHHTVKDGKLVVIWKGVAKAMTELLGVKGKTNIPEEDVEACYEHLAQHYGQFDKKVPEKKVSYELLEDEDNAMINGLQILAGKLSGEDKEAVDSAISFIQAKNADLADKHKQICNFDDESDDRPVYQLNSSTTIELSEDGTFRKQILKYGKWYHWAARNGELKITKDLISNIVDNFKQKIIENVSVPLTHTDDPSKNTGRVVDLIQTEKGLDAIIEVKDKSIVQKIKDDLIKCISASIDPNYREKTSNKFVGATLLHAALVQEPFIKGMQGFVPLSDDFKGRPIYQFEDTELSVQEEILNIKQQLIKLSMENENDKSTEDTDKKDDVENTDETKDTDTEDKTTDETKDKETTDDNAEDKKDEDKKDTEEKTDEVSDDEISKSFDATLNEYAQELVKSKKIDKSKYTECVKTEMKDGKKLAEAVKVCKAKVKKQLSEVESEVKKSDETKEVQQTDKKEKVDMSDAENMYKEYLEKGQIIPAQKEAFIQLFATTKALNLSDEKVGLHKIMKSFLDAQAKTVDFSEKGTDATDDAPAGDSKADDNAEIPDDVKKFYSEKMGFDDKTMKEAWSHAKELKAEENEMKETIFSE